MKKLFVAIAIVGVFLLYSLMHAHSDAIAITSPPSTNTGSGGASTANGATVTAIPGALYRDGTYTGPVTDAQWGNVQVKTTIKGGKITDVQFVDYPHDRNRSISINQYADPQLIQEAIQAQSAQVDAISGATDTSFAFMQSLADALTQAKA